MKSFAKFAGLPRPPHWWLYRRPYELHDVQQALAYEQAVGHPARNLEPGDPGYEQWTWNPRSRHARPLEEVAA